LFTKGKIKNKSITVYMMDKSIGLSGKELSYISDTDFLVTKFTITEKIVGLFADTEQKLQLVVGESGFPFKEHWLHKPGKISKGENYQRLPYVVLDYPRYFHNHEVFAFRSMFWWGNFFSGSLHLKGYWLEEMKGRIYKKLLKSPGDAFICVNNSPWEYHYGEENYRLVKELQPEILERVIFDRPFIKISRKLGLENWQQVPVFCMGSFQEFLQLMKED
jgi:hypothetical protein